MPKKLQRLVMVSGPSCAGKSPLKDAFDAEYPELAKNFVTPVLYNSRSPRPDEKDGKDYHFRTRQKIDELRSKDHFAVIRARDDLQAVDLKELRESLQESDAFYEGNVHVALELKRAVADYAEVLDVFLSPLALVEVRELMGCSAALADTVAEMMRRRLMRRGLSKKPVLSLPDLQDFETRATAAYHELSHAPEFSYVIPNHDGEDSDNWRVFARPVGDARRSVQALASLIRGEEPSWAEHWPADVIQDGGDCR